MDLPLFETVHQLVPRAERRLQRLGQQGQVFCRNAMRSVKVQGKTVRFSERDEHHRKLAVGEQRFVKVGQQGVLVVAVRHGVVGGAEHFVQVGQALYLLGCLHALDGAADLLHHVVEQGLVFGQEGCAGCAGCAGLGRVPGVQLRAGV